jgi:hypothetical protein
MGFNVEMLSEAQGPYYYSKAPTRLELEECIHFHFDNFRFLWTTSEFKKVFSLFNEAKDKLEETGWLEKSYPMKFLSGDLLENKSLQYNRWAIELTQGDWIHIHLGGLRILLTPLDFEHLFSMFREASIEFYNKIKTNIDITTSDIGLPSHVKTTYLPLLKKYEEGQFTKVKATDVGRLRAKVKWFICHAEGNRSSDEIQRKMDEPFNFTYGTVSEDLDTEYLFAIYESIKEWGYADGPFYGELINAYQLEDRIQIGSAHRIAVLLALGYKKTDIFLTKLRENPA